MQRIKTVIDVGEGESFPGVFSRLCLLMLKERTIGTKLFIMRNFKFLSLLMFVVLSVGFTACGDDDDDEISADNLVGTWELYWSAGYEKYNGEEDRWDEAVDESDKFRMTFNSDGTGVEDDDNQSFNWKLDGKKLTITGGGESQTVTLVKMSSSELVVESSEKGTDNGKPYEFYDKLTFKRVK